MTRRTDKKKDEKIVIRLPKYLKNSFKNALTLNDENQSEVVRGFIKSYIVTKKNKK
jgi:metal-responsive CopG/Arc/MetJ family transcriptional regulator